MDSLSRRRMMRIIVVVLPVLLVARGQLVWEVALLVVEEVVGIGDGTPTQLIGALLLHSYNTRDPLIDVDEDERSLMFGLNDSFHLRTGWVWVFFFCSAFCAFFLFVLVDYCVFVFLLMLESHRSCPDFLNFFSYIWFHFPLCS